MATSTGNARAGPTAAARRAMLRQAKPGPVPGVPSVQLATVEAARPLTRRLMTEGAYIMKSYVVVWKIVLCAGRQLLRGSDFGLGRVGGMQ